MLQVAVAIEKPDHGADASGGRGCASVVYHCPECVLPLTERDSGLACGTCSRFYPVVDGIPMLRAKPDTYYGEFTQEEMSRLLSDAKGDLDRTLARWLREKQASPRLGEYIMGAGRAGWQFLLPVSSDSVVLDLGCGWGTLAHSFAKTCRSVVALDSTVERMQFLRLRAEKEGLRSLQFVCAGDGKHLPFASATFDVVLLNGVLEWVPSGRDGDPRDLQLALLREVRRVLRPTGALYLAIENRYAWKTWFLHPDGHAGLRFVPWLPRSVANIYSRLHGKGEYRNYLYGRRQYRRLLASAEFDQTEFYVPLPGYHHPVAMVSASESREIGRQVARPRASLGGRARQRLKGMLAGTFPDAYGIVAAGPKADESFLRRLLRMLGGMRPDVFGGPHRLAAYRINGEMGMVTVVVEQEGQHNGGFVLRLPLHERAATEIAWEAQGLEAFQDGANRLAALAPLVPVPLYQGDFEGRRVAAFSRLSGVSAESLFSKAEDHRGVTQAIGFAVRLHELTACDGAVPESELISLVEACRQPVKRLAHTSERERGVDALIERVVGELRQWRVPLVMGHGDFKLANCLFRSDTGELSGVLDWGAGLRRELPLYDVSFLLLDSRAKREGRTLGEVLGQWMKGGTPAMPAELHDLPAKLRLEAPNLLFVMGAYQWLKRMAPLGGTYEARRFDYRYVDSMFEALPC